MRILHAQVGYCTCWCGSVLLARIRLCFWYDAISPHMNRLTQLMFCELGVHRVLTRDTWWHEKSSTFKPGELCFILFFHIICQPCDHTGGSSKYGIWGNFEAIPLVGSVEAFIIGMVTYTCKKYVFKLFLWTTLWLGCMLDDMVIWVLLVNNYSYLFRIYMHKFRSSSPVSITEFPPLVFLGN